MTARYWVVVYNEKGNAILSAPVGKMTAEHSMYSPPVFEVKSGWPEGWGLHVPPGVPAPVEPEHDRHIHPNFRHPEYPLDPTPYVEIELEVHTLNGTSFRRLSDRRFAEPSPTRVFAPRYGFAAWEADYHLEGAADA